MSREQNQKNEADEIKGDAEFIAEHSKKYVEDYLEFVEEFPNDVQRYLTELMEIDIEYRAILDKLDYLKSKARMEKTTNLKEILIQIYKAMIEAQALADKKIELSQSIADMVSEKVYQMKKNERILRESEWAEVQSRNSEFFSGGGKPEGASSGSHSMVSEHKKQTPKQLEEAPKWCDIDTSSDSSSGDRWKASYSRKDRTKKGRRKKKGTPVTGTKQLKQTPKQLVVKLPKQLFEESSKQMDVESPKQFFGESPKQFFGESSKQFFGESSKQFFGESSKQFFGESSKQFFGESSKQSVRESSKQFFGQSSNQSVGKSSKQSVRKSSKKSVGKSSKKSVGKSSKKSVGKSSKKSVGKSSKKSVGKSSKKSVGKSSKKSVGKSRLSVRKSKSSKQLVGNFPESYDFNASNDTSSDDRKKPACSTKCTTKQQKKKKKRRKKKVKRSSSKKNNEIELLNEDIDITELLYCICNKGFHSDMIACDDSECDIEWYHFGCVGLEKEPEGKWYCPSCRNNQRAEAANKHAKKN